MAQSSLGCHQLAPILGEPAGPELTVQVIGVEISGPDICLQRALRVAKAGNRTKVSIGRRGVLVITYDLCRLRLCELLQQRLGLSWLIGGQEVERPLKPRVTRISPCRDV